MQGDSGAAGREKRPDQAPAGGVPPASPFCPEGQFGSANRRARHRPDNSGTTRDSSPPASQWFTPPQIARERAVRVGKVLAWIRGGELEAVNHAERRGGRPRWRVSASALAAFDLARSNRSHLPPPAPRVLRAQAKVVPFF